MRVTHVITRLIVGGAQENTVASVVGLSQKPNLQVRLISGPTSGPEGSLEPLLAHLPQALTVLPELVRPVRPWKDLVGLRRLTELLRVQAPDIVHTHSGKAGVLGRLAARRAGVPIIIHTIHGPSFGAFQSPLANLVFRAAERYAGRVTTHFVVVAEAMKRQYLAAGIGQAQDYTTVRSGFNLEPFLASANDQLLRAKLGLAAEDIVVGKIARLCELKGHEDLLAVAPDLVQACPRLKFLLVGDGPWRERFQSQVREMGLESHFKFTGLVAPETVAPLVGIMDMLVHLSVREGLARALPQALAAGRPAVAYDCDGATEVIFEGETGYLLAPGDRAGLKERLLQLAADSALRERLGRQGRAFVRTRFSVEQMVQELHQLYERLRRA